MGIFDDGDKSIGAAVGEQLWGINDGPGKLGDLTGQQRRMSENPDVRGSSFGRDGAFDVLNHAIWGGSKK